MSLKKAKKPDKYRWIHVVQTRHEGEWVVLHATEHEGEATVCMGAYQESYPDHFYRIIKRREIVIPETFSELVQRESKTTMLSEISEGKLGEALIRIAREALGP